MRSVAFVNKLLGIAGELLSFTGKPYVEPFLLLLQETFRETYLPSVSLPVLRYLPLLPKHAVPETRPFVEALVGGAGALNWRQTYDRNDQPGSDFVENYGFTALVSPTGPLVSEKVRLGVLFLGPHTLYPEHAHAAEEIYLVLSGSAAWSQGGEPARREQPGATIYHRSHVWHSVQTGEEPLLALYAWRGADNTVPKSYFREQKT